MIGVATFLGSVGAFASGEGGEQESKRLKLGLDLGFAVPFGQFFETGAGAPVNREVAHQIPIGLEAGYQLTPQVLVGLYGQYGFVSVRDKSNPNDWGCGAVQTQPGVTQTQTCSGHDLKLGLEGKYSFLPKSGADPWIGLGVAYEDLKLVHEGTITYPPPDSQSGPYTLGFGFQGVDLDLKAGVDFKATEALSAGPFVSYSVGEYFHGSDGTIESKALHEWLTIGVRGTFGI